MMGHTFELSGTGGIEGGCNRLIRVYYWMVKTGLNVLRTYFESKIIIYNFIDMNTFNSSILTLNFVVEEMENSLR